MRRFAVYTCALVAAALVSTAFGRQWTDSTGKFNIDAEFVSYDAGQITLKKPDGTKLQLPLEKLSKADRDFVKTLVPELRTKPVDANENPFLVKPAAPPKALAAPLPLPKGVDAAALKKAEETVNSLFKDDLANTRTPQQRTDLARKLLQTGKDTRDDPASQFVLFRKAAELAAAAGDADTAFSALEQLDSLIDALPIWAVALESLAKNSKTASDAAEKADALIDRAYAKDDYVSAGRLAGIMTVAARTTKDAALFRAATARSTEVAAVQVEFKKLAPAREKLVNAPLDPQANAVVGKFLCFVKRDWEHGIPMLSRGDDKSLMRVAALELKEDKTTGDLVSLGDSWLELAKVNDARSAAKERSSYWYKLALPDISGLVRIRVEKQLLAVLAGPSAARVGEKNLLLEVMNDPMKHAVKGSWSVKGRDLICNSNGNNSSILMLPGRIPHSYELTVEFTRLTGDDALAVDIPVGNTAVAICLAGHHSGYSGLENVDGNNPTKVSPSNIQINHKYILKAVVKVTDKIQTITASLDGRQLFQWSGRTDTLSVPDYWRIPELKHVGLCGWNSDFVFHKVSLNEAASKSER